MKPDSRIKTAKSAWMSSAKSHAGSVRPLNEDAFLNKPDAGLWCVADGMGGHLKGEIASSLIVEKLSELLDKSEALSTDAITSAINDANREIFAISQQLGEKVGSTVAVLFLQNHIAHALWAGDSRIYHLSDNKLVRVTEDHNQAAELVKYGFLAPERMQRHPGSSLLTRAVGTNPSLKLDYKTLAWKASDKFILCSDGLNDVMDVASIEAQLPKTESVNLSEWLIDSALDNWAIDNITAVAVHCL